nr:hypothetical protein Q903MT_gene2315 [Picea sitchensis]
MNRVRKKNKESCENQIHSVLAFITFIYEHLEGTVLPPMLAQESYKGLYLALVGSCHKKRSSISLLKRLREIKLELN